MFGSLLSSSLKGHMYTQQYPYSGCWCGRHVCSVGECLPSLLKPDNGFVDLCHSLADSTLLEFLCAYLSEGLPFGDALKFR